MVQIPVSGTSTDIAMDVAMNLAPDPTTDLATNLTLVFEDDSLLVLNKPSGLLSVPGRGEDKQDCLSSRVQQHFPDALVVHRLDMATSGLLLMARGIAMQRALSSLFERRQIHKRYVAVVAGQLHAQALSTGGADGWQLIDLPIAVDWPRRPLRIIDAALGKSSQTRWRSLRFAADLQTSRVELEPLTGRSHQLRVHLQAIGHPILGDQLYAPAEILAASPRLLLHATSLVFVHPQTGEPLRFDCQPDF